MKQYKRLTIPSLAKETTLNKDGFFSQAGLTSQYIEEDEVTADLPAIPYENQWTHQSSSQRVVEDEVTADLPAMPYENQWTHQERYTDVLDTFRPGAIPFTPRPTRSNGHNGSNGHTKGHQVGAFFTIPFTPRPTQPNGSNGHANGHNGSNGHTNNHQVSAFFTIPFTPRPTQSNGHNNGHVKDTDALLTVPFTPRPAQSHGHNGHNASNTAAFQIAAIPFVPDPQIGAIINAVVVNAVKERETNHEAWESLVVSATRSKGKVASKWAFFLELPHLLVYIIGTLAIAGLYLIIPLLNLLHATIPGHLNTMLIALCIIVPGELLVCVTLARTIPRRKVKKGSGIAQP
jgi:hypothetical protein